MILFLFKQSNYSHTHTHSLSLFLSLSLTLACRQTYRLIGNSCIYKKYYYIFETHHIQGNNNGKLTVGSEFVVSLGESFLFLL